MYIAVDFDGTIVEHEYPAIGRPVHGACKWLKLMKKRGGKLILWTCRNGQRLDEAIKYCEEQGIVFDYINENPKYQGLSNKIYADVYIDDRAVGCSTRSAYSAYVQQSVNWDKVGPAIMRLLKRKKPVTKVHPFSRIWNVICSKPQRIVIERGPS